MARTMFRQEDRRRLRTIAEEIPKIQSLMKELVETVDIMGNNKELGTFRESLEQIRRGETRRWDEYVYELRKKGEIQA